MAQEPGTFVTVAAAAVTLDITPHAVALLAATGLLESVEHEGRVMVSETSVDAARALRKVCAP